VILVEYERVITEDEVCRIFVNLTAKISRLSDKNLLFARLPEVH